jgi:phosphatidylserine/phosphatidylglycerophosphate/cardiolipin synthase-like enzyme
MILRGKTLIIFIFIFLFGVVMGGFICLQVAKSVYIPTNLSPNQIVPITDGNYFPNVHNLLISANLSIHMVMFDVKYYPNYPESLENTLLNDLIEKAKEGIDIRIVTDEYLTEKPVLTYLKNNGVNIKYDSKERTTHSKLIIIDGKIVIVGSTNWSYYSLERNREANVVVYSEGLAKKFETYFNQIWGET